MNRHACLVLALATLSTPALAQNEPFRVVNGTRQPAKALHVVRTGQEGWGPNLLTRGLLAPGAALSMRPPEGAGCKFDLRLVFQNGQDAIRRDADVCQERLVVVTGINDATTPPAAAPPQAGGHD